MPLDNLFVPVIHPDRMAGYSDAEFSLTTGADGSLDIAFTPHVADDLEVYVPSRGLYFFLPGGQEKVLPGGPTVTPSTNAVAIQLLNVSDILSETRAVMPPPPTFAAWWIVEGIDGPSITELLHRNFDDAALNSHASGAGYGDVPTLETALLQGQASVNVLFKDAAGADLVSPAAVPIARLAGAAGSAVTFRLTTSYGWGGTPTQYSPLAASSSLALIGLVRSDLALHPLVTRAKADAITGDLALYVSFQYWEPYDPPAPAVAQHETDKGSYKSLPTGTVVRLMRVSEADPDDRTELVSGALNAAGLVEFDPGGAAPHAVARSTLAAGAGYALAFLVEAPPDAFTTQYQRDGAPRAAASRLEWRTGAGAPWPDVWLTAGFTSPSGEAGSLKDLDTLPAASLGLPSAPIVYNVGVPVFLQILYPRLKNIGSVYSTSDQRAPKGVKVLIRNSGGADLGEFRTDEHGQVWGLLTHWDPRDTNIRVIVKYEMEDRPPAGSAYPLALPRITGIVMDDAAPPNQSDHFDSSWTDPGATVGAARTTFGFSGPFAAASLGTSAGGATATGLEEVRLGAIQAGPTRYELVSGASRFLGEHGGLMHAFKTIRHAHEWWYQLTDTVGALVDRRGQAEAELKIRWADLFDRLHRPDPEPPVLRVIVQHQPNPAIRGGIGVEHEAGVDLFVLTLLYQTRWDVNDTFDNPPDMGITVQPAELSLLWNRATIHHEFCHLVFMAATELYGANAASLAEALSVYDNRYDVFGIEPDTYTPLVEGLSSILNLATVGNFAGFSFQTGTGGVALVSTFPHSPNLNSISRNTLNPVLDDRLGLWVPGAVAQAYWNYFTLSTRATPLQPIPDTDAQDLKHEPLASSIRNDTVRTLFQRVLWLPMRALRIPDRRASAEWDSIAGPVLFPTTFSLMQHLASDRDCYARLNGTDQYALTTVFGIWQPRSWYLWNQF